MTRVLLALCLSCFGAYACAQDIPDFFKNLLQQLPAQGTSPGTKPPAPQQKPQAQPAGGGMLFGDTPVEEEIAIGRRLAGDLLGAVALVRDDRLQSYVNRVGRWVAMQSERADLNWYFGVLDSNDINAFALPGGYVFVTRGLYAKLSSEAELAGVLGHEIGHVVMKHHLKVLKQSQMVSSISGFFGQQIARDGGPAMVQNILGNGAEAAARGLDKEAEYESDRIGVVLATRAGYDPYALPVVLQRIAGVNPDDASLALLFKTHPRPQERLAKLGEAMGDSFDKYGDGKTLPARFPRVGK
jgi:beta-barrel assembly-enhancing protease